jgi:hypothetical protein
MAKGRFDCLQTSLEFSQAAATRSACSLISTCQFRSYGDADKRPAIENATAERFYRPDAAGLYGMHGNVAKRCLYLDIWRYSRDVLEQLATGGVGVAILPPDAWAEFNPARVQVFRGRPANAVARFGNFVQCSGRIWNAARSCSNG